jgi:hypothetical protein
MREVTNVLLGPMDSNDASERRPRISAGAPLARFTSDDGRKRCSTGYPPLLRRSKVLPRVADGIECQIGAWVEVLLVERGVNAVAADRPLEAMEQLGSAVSAPMDGDR